MKKSTADHMHRKRRKNNLVWLFALLGILVLFLGTILAFLIFSNLSSKSAETVQEVSAVNGVGIILPAHFTERKITNPATARDAINDVADNLGIVSVEDELGTADCNTVFGDTYYGFQQMYQGIPVYGRKVIVSADANDEAVLLSSGFYPIENLSVEPRINRDDAEKIVAGLYQEETDVYVDNLVVFSLDERNPELAWKISVNQNDSWETVFLSAVDGRVLKTFSNELTDNELGNNHFTNIYLYDAENQDVTVDLKIIFDDGTIATYDGDNEYVSLNDRKYTTSGSWRQVVLTSQNGEHYKEIGKGGFSISAKATELLPIDIASLTDGMGTPIVALAKVLAASNFYRDVLGYDTFGDDNKAMAVIVNDHRGGADSGNASAGYGESKIFTRISIGSTCSPMIDTLGHEVTHAVEQSISHMIYEGESGAIMEACSDIMGEIIEDWYNDSPQRVYPNMLEHWNVPFETSLKWLDGNISWIYGTVGELERNLADPSSVRQGDGLPYPTSYNDANWRKSKNYDPDAPFSDHGGVHSNCTVISHAAYLMAQPSVDKTKYEPLSTYELAQLFYKALYGISKSDTNFSEFRSVLTYTAYSMCQAGMLTAKQVAMVDWAIGTKAGIPNSLFLDENENSVVSLDEQAKLYVYADDGTLCDNYDLHIARLDMDTLPVEYDENLPRTVSYDYSVRKADTFQIDLTPGNYEFVLTDPSGQEPSEIEYLRILENDGLKGYPFYPGFKNSNDPPFEPSGEHQYKIFYDTLTWEEAKAACEAKGGHLATITSEEEQQKLNLYNAGNHNLWIGGYKNADGQWCWVNGEPWTYENWGNGEPNNSSNVVAGESCVAMWPEKWNDLANSNTYEQSGYICEWEVSNAAEETQVEGYTGHLYEFYTLPESEWESGPITWQQAERRCEWKGGHLAVIESSTENFLLYSAMKAKGYENAYFGFSDESSEGNWKWVDGTSTAYTNWHSGEPNNQDGIEHYAMFYEKFQDGTWNDADGIIDAGCAYICEWDDPTDKISQGDSFTDQQLRIIAKDLGVPDDLNVETKQYPKTYWKAAGLWDIYVEVLLDGKVIASGSFDVETGEMGRNLYIYSH